MMRKTIDKEKELLTAVRGFAQSVSSNKNTVADISELVEITNNMPLQNLDFWERKIRNEFASVLGEFSYWGASKKERLLTWLDLFSWDGYKREKVLNSISGKVPNAFFFLMVFRRLNDWVPSVRASARDKVYVLAKETDADTVAEALLVVLRLWNSWGRMSDKEKEVILKVSSLEKVAEKLKERVLVSNQGSMSSLLTQLARASIISVDDLEVMITKALQPSVRAKATRFLFEGRVIWVEGRKFEWTDKAFCQGRYVPILAERKLEDYPKKCELLNLVKNDRSAIVRRVAAEFLIRMLDRIEVEAARKIAEQFSNDSSRAVSERGRFVLKQLAEESGDNHLIERI